jgi:hypothetical protein
MYLGRAEIRTMFSILTTNGKLIRAHSHLQNDDEILLPPGILLKVTGSLNLNNAAHVIYLREIEPPCPRLAKPFDLRQINKTLLSGQANATSSTGKSITSV